MPIFKSESGTWASKVVRLISCGGLARSTESAFSVDVKRSDIGFDALPLADGSWLVTGASDWQQNPHGASVSEESQTFLSRVSESGERSALTLPTSLQGPRHNEGRVLLPLGSGRWLIGGLTDGPGTHSGDADASRVRAAGFLRELQLDLGAAE
jgi:hypothetical protein